MTRAPASVLGVALVAATIAGASSVARAQPVTTAEDLMAPPRVPPRPRLSLAVGMGASFDTTGFAPARTRAIPAFLAMGGIGDRRIGFGAMAFSTQATGRYRLPDSPVDRLGLDAMVVVRPAVMGDVEGPTGYGWRLLRSLAVELGLGLERDGRGPVSGSRIGVHTGGHFVLPLSPAASRTQLGLRLGARALLGVYVPRVGGTDVGDTFDLYAALQVGF